MNLHLLLGSRKVPSSKPHQPGAHGPSRGDCFSASECLERRLRSINLTFSQTFQLLHVLNSNECEPVLRAGDSSESATTSTPRSLPFWFQSGSPFLFEAQGFASAPSLTTFFFLYTLFHFASFYFFFLCLLSLLPENFVILVSYFLPMFLLIITVHGVYLAPFLLQLHIFGRYYIDHGFCSL